MQSIKINTILQWLQKNRLQTTRKDLFFAIADKNVLQINMSFYWFEENLCPFYQFSYPVPDARAYQVWF